MEWIGAAGGDLWFKKATYIDVRKGEVIEGAVIRVVGGVVAEIRESLPADVKDAIDCSGRFLTPGLIDMHVHIVWDGGPAPVRTMLDEGNYVAAFRGLANAQASLRRGVTTVRDVGSPDDVAIHLAHAIDRGIVEACDVVPAGRALQITGGHVPDVGIIADTSDEILKAIRYLKSIGARWIKIMATGGAYGPEQIGPVLYSLDELRLIVSEAHRLRLKVAAHALSEEGIRNCIEAGIDTIEHGAIIPENQASRMKEKGIAYIPTLSVYRSLADDLKLPPNIVEKAQFVVENQRKSFSRAIKAGVTIALGTDAGSPGFGPHPSVVKEMSVMEEYGMSRADVIRSATLNACEILDRHDIGLIEVGRKADFLILESNPLEDLRAFGKIHSVYKRGKLV